MAVADHLNGIDPGDNLGRGGLIVPSVSAGEDAGVQRAADDDRCAGLDALWQQILKRRLFQQWYSGRREGTRPRCPTPWLRAAPRAR